MYVPDLPGLSFKTRAASHLRIVFVLYHTWYLYVLPSFFGLAYSWAIATTRRIVSGLNQFARTLASQRDFSRMRGTPKLASLSNQE